MNRVNFIFLCVFALLATSPFFINMDTTQKTNPVEQVKDAMPLISKLLPPGVLLKRKKTMTEDLWACSCSNMRDSQACSQGQTFHSMTAAAQFAKHQCGDDCTLNCHPRHSTKVVEDETPQDPDDTVL
jgi:hypothetical protein